LPMASWPREVVDCSSVNNPTSRSPGGPPMNRTSAPGLLLVGVFTLLASTTSRGKEAIGSTTSVKPQAEANTRMLSGGSTVYSKELIHTGDAGMADLRFHDNSNLSVGPKSSVRLH